MSKQPKLALIGGTGLTEMQSVKLMNSSPVDTDYGQPSSDLFDLEIEGRAVTFLARHGQPHRIPPHLINYRANIAALKAHGVEQIIAVNAVGSIDPRLKAKDIVIPDQIIDYTWGRAPTFFDGDLMALDHVDFSYPLNEAIRSGLVQAAQKSNIHVVAQGTYGVTQGPRLETAAEIKRMAQDGCTLVGMTLMPEAILAHELGLAYASICLVVNPAAGVAEGVITLEEIHQAINEGMADVQRILRAYC